MSQTREDKKRKRKEEESHIMSRKSKTSKTSENSAVAPAPEQPVFHGHEQKEKKDKKRRKTREGEQTPSVTGTTCETNKSQEKGVKSVEETQVKLGKTKKKSKSKRREDAAALAETDVQALDDASTTLRSHSEASKDVSAELNATKGVSSDKKEKGGETKKRKKEGKGEEESKKRKKLKRKAENEIVGEELIDGKSREDSQIVKNNGEEFAKEQANEDDAGGIPIPSERNQGPFIVFVGNLPYSATKEQIEKHFAKIKPKDIRIRTYKDTKKFMGTCFLEFDRSDRMEACLKQYHHSLFPDGKKKSEGRKINVELSAGGGGNSEARKSKILAKNEKLNEERARLHAKRTELETKRAERKEKKGSRGKTDQTQESATKGAVEPGHDGMHPERLAMMSLPAPSTYRKRF